MKRGKTMRVYVRTCGATRVTAEIFRGNRRLSTRTSRVARFRRLHPFARAGPLHGSA